MKWDSKKYELKVKIFNLQFAVTRDSNCNCGHFLVKTALQIPPKNPIQVLHIGILNTACQQ